MGSGGRWPLAPFTTPRCCNHSKSKYSATWAEAEPQPPRADREGLHINGYLDLHTPCCPGFLIRGCNCSSLSGKLTGIKYLSSSERKPCRGDDKEKEILKPTHHQPGKVALAPMYVPAPSCAPSCTPRTNPRGVGTESCPTARLALGGQSKPRSPGGRVSPSKTTHLLIFPASGQAGPVPQQRESLVHREEDGDATWWTILSPQLVAPGHHYSKWQQKYEPLSNSFLSGLTHRVWGAQRRFQSRVFPMNDKQPFLIFHLLPFFPSQAADKAFLSPQMMIDNET